MIKLKTPLLLLNYFTYDYCKEKLKKNYYKLLKNIVLHTIIKESLHKINPKFDQAFLTNILESEKKATRQKTSIHPFVFRAKRTEKEGWKGGEAEEKSEQS